MAYIYDFADTWNNAGTVFNGIKLNVTNTASAAASKLMDLQVNNVSAFSVDRAGDLFLNGQFGGSVGTNNYLYLYSGAESNREKCFAFRSDGMSVANGIGFTFSDGEYTYNASSGAPLVKGDGKRFGTTNVAAMALQAVSGAAAAAEWRVYKTFTDTSNYERFTYGWSGDSAVLKTEAAGTGTKRNVVIDGANRAAYDAAPSTTVIRDILISFGLMAPV